MIFQTEKDSIDFFVTQLETSGFTDICATQSTNQYCHYDVSAQWGKKKVVFELKRRNFTSDKFGDSSIEASKFIKLEKDKRDGNIFDGYVVSFFDDIYTIDSIGGEYSIRSVNCAKTTEFADQTKEDKLFICFPQNKKFNY